MMTLVDVESLSERGRDKAGDVGQVGHPPQPRPTAPRSESDSKRPEIGSEAWVRAMIANKLNPEEHDRP